MPSLLSVRSTLSLFNTKRTDDVGISPICLLSLMLWGFDNHRTWTGITTPLFSARIWSRIFCRPSAPLPFYLTIGTACISSLSQESFSWTWMTHVATVRAALMMTSRYFSVITAAAFRWVIAVIVPLSFLFGFMIRMWAGAFWLKSPPLIADAISCSIMSGRGTPSSIHGIRHPSAMLNPDFRAGPGPAAALWLFVRGWTVSNRLRRVGVGLRVGSCCCSDCRVIRTLDLGLALCHSWHSSGLPSCTPRACSEAPRPSPSCLAFLSLFSFLSSWVGAAWPTYTVASTFAVMSTMPTPHWMLSLWKSSQLVSQSSSQSIMPHHCTSRPTVCDSSILAILCIVWCSWVTSRACCRTVRSIRLHQSPSVLNGSEVSFLSQFPFLLHSHCLLAAMHQQKMKSHSQHSEHFEIQVRLFSIMDSTPAGNILSKIVFISLRDH